MRRHNTAKTTYFEMIPLEDVLKRVPGAAADEKDTAQLENPIGEPKSRKHGARRVSPQSGDGSDEKRR
jgi:hypothetical protein